MAVVTVSPQEFNFVEFDAARIAELTERLAGEVGLASDVEITVTVDETSPLGRATLDGTDPIAISTESGSFESARKPRQMSDRSTADVVGRLLFRARDILDQAFGAPESWDDLDLSYKTAWDIYCVGRLARLGYKPQRQRRLYHFRNRCGFTDAADDAFDEIWTSESLTWGEIVGLVDGALEVVEEAASA